MNLKSFLLILLTSVFLQLNAAFAQANYEEAFVYQVTGVKGKVFIELPNGKRQVAQVGMKVGHDSKVMVLENSLLTGFDLASKCEVEYREHTWTKPRRVKSCTIATKNYTNPRVVKKITKSYRVNYTPYLLGGAAVLLVASTLDDDDDDRQPVSR